MTVFAVSYDPVEVLAEFSEAHGISFPLLSDEGSQVMERLGLLNQHVAEQQAFFGMPVKDRHRGIPYPGTFVLDERGVVTAKHFEQSYRERPSGEYLLHELGGEVDAAAVKVAARDEGIEFAAWSASGRFRPLEKTVLHLRIALAPGRHAYVPPVPPGYVALAVDIEPQEGIRGWPVRLPAGSAHRVRGLDAQFRVVDGAVDLTVACMISGRRYFIDGRPRPEPLENRDVTVALRVAYQTCTDAVCSAPGVQRLLLRLLEEDLVDTGH